MLEISIFAILSLFIVGGSVAMIINKQTLLSAFGFLVAMLGLAGMFALLDSRFLALAQIMVSVGAIIVLSMLTILTINAKEENLPHEPYKYRWILFSSIIVSPFTLLLYKTLHSFGKGFEQGESFTATLIGKTLFREWVLPFEIVSVLLISAMIGAIVIARKEKKKEEQS